MQSMPYTTSPTTDEDDAIYLLAGGPPRNTPTKARGKAGRCPTMSGLRRHKARHSSTTRAPDRWIGTPIRQDGRTGEYVDLTKGETLDVEETGDYRR